MKIVIFAGGSGSVELQRGLYRSLDRNFDGIETKIIVNAYDNGLSTGAVRRVLDRQILGPSDVRKNQATRLRLVRPNDPWISFLDRRFTADVAHAQRSCLDEAAHLREQLKKSGNSGESVDLIVGAIDAYFDAPRARHITYDDFAIANIVYAGLARQNDNSLRAAARIMATLLGIPDCVILNDDKSLFLGATTRNGVRVTDEGDIVSWGNEADPFVDVFFQDAEGNESCPRLCLEAWQAIIEADLIILSTGTPWSSLIPTYASTGFKEAIRASAAKIVMVMNRVPDKDSTGQTASDLINILVPRYFDRNRLHVLMDSHGHTGMSSLNEAAAAKVAFWMKAELSTPADPIDRHNPTLLADGIGRIFFADCFDSELFLFDYDDTIRGRNGQFPLSSRFNVDAVRRLNRMTSVALCTGNSIRAIDMTGRSDGHKPLAIFADGGVNLYSCDLRCPIEDTRWQREVKCIAPDALLPTTGPLAAREIIACLQDAGIPATNIDNRGNALIAIKPVPRERRLPLTRLIHSIAGDTSILVRDAGTTTIEIRGRSLSKLHSLHYLFAQSSAPARITYIGDECDFGNDAEISQLAKEDPRVICLRVRDPAMTAFFLATLLEHLNQDA